uniref:SGNH domain-containing protein n=1 Tax=Angiostrongylus cantonensis TaxID=6313 RepID=A0A0K0DIM1_ANGCA
MVLTETFEKAYLRAAKKRIFYLIFCLYATIVAFWMSETSQKFFKYDAKYLTELFTPAVPWGWCDLPVESSNSSRTILVIGNSYAANQGRVVYEGCSGSNVEVKIYSLGGCEVLTVTKEFDHCHDSRKLFCEAVSEYKPDVLFILTR